MSSAVSHGEYRSRFNYAASKSWFDHFTKSVAREVAPVVSGARFGRSGFIESDMTDALQKMKDAMLGPSANETCIGQAEEVAEVAA